MAVRVSSNDFDISAEMAKLSAGDTAIGGVALFVGKVRGSSRGQPLVSMTLEHYPGMTEAELERIEAEARARFRLSGSLIVHRVGELKPGDNIVLVIACASHRQDAFAGAEYLMDYLKTRAPFWKKETLADGSAVWVEARECDEDAAAAWGSKSDRP
ncbi:MAG: molybdenum cofactor biosynthesis protein MoaE [Hyphomicrobium sp.]|uniref:molybdenum cofactor biosynthesis protein MoaE n=1 Tax=Hyphomicrobium sp. TaxID=82 RepID=UPI0039E6ADEE